MGKSMYSLMLSDEIVEAVDVLAAANGQGRSALINHVLAEFASLSTPEARIRQVIAEVEQRVDRAVMRACVSQSGTLTLSTALRYKYNPNLRYVVELYHESPCLGEVRVGLRSQNEALLEYLEVFFELWCCLEAHHLKNPPTPGLYEAGNARYRRVLRRPTGEGEMTRQEAGEAIAAYLSRMDGCIKAFFANLHDATVAAQAVEAQYLSHSGKNGRADAL